MTETAVITSFDHELEAERIRWLRRRFLWLCGVSVVLTFLLELTTIPELASDDARTRDAAWLSVGGSLLSIAMYAAAGWYAWRAPRLKRRILALAFWLTVLPALLTIVSIRISIHLDVDKWREPGETTTPAQIWAFLAPFLILLNHLLTCLFIPWTLREAARPAAVLVIAVGATIVADVIFGLLAPRWLFILPLVALAAGPGLLVCWWRFSRFRGQYRLVFESRAYRQLQNELSGARRVHESCLPPQCDQGPIRLSYVYEPNQEIGGDLIYVHRPERHGRAADDAAMTVVVLDVTGHGIAAALAVNRLVGELERIFAERPDGSPGEVLCALNRYVCLTMTRHTMYLTALVVRADPSHDRIEWANGGHPPAFLCRADGSTEPLDSTAPMLGACDESDGFSAEPGQLPFRPGDALVAYTDGAAEAADAEDEQIGIAGVGELARLAGARCSSPRDWPAEMLRAVAAHRDGPPKDDTLLLTLFRPAWPRIAGGEGAEGSKPMIPEATPAKASSGGHAWSAQQ